MKRFDFRLERLLTVKKQMERLAEQRQQQARAEFEVATAEIAKAQGRVEEAGSGGIEMLRQAATLGCWQARYERVASLELLVVAALDQAASFQERLRVAGMIRTRIASEVEALEHLRQKHAKNHRADVLRHQYEQVDEVGMRRWTAGAKDGNGGESSQEEYR